MEILDLEADGAQFGAGANSEGGHTDAEAKWEAGLHHVLNTTLREFAHGCEDM